MRCISMIAPRIITSSSINQLLWVLQEIGNSNKNIPCAHQCDLRASKLSPCIVCDSGKFVVNESKCKIPTCLSTKPLTKILDKIHVNPNCTILGSHLSTLWGNPQVLRGCSIWMEFILLLWQCMVIPIFHKFIEMSLDQRGPQPLKKLANQCKLDVRLLAATCMWNMYITYMWIALVLL